MTESSTGHSANFSNVFRNESAGQMGSGLLLAFNNLINCYITVFIPRKHLSVERHDPLCRLWLWQSWPTEQFDLSGQGTQKKDIEKNKVAQEGIYIACEQIEEFKAINGVHGVYMMAIESEHMVPQITEQAKVLQRPVFS